LFTKQKSYINKFNYKLDRGIKYYRFVLYNKINNDKLIYKFLDFFLNKILYLIEKKYIKQFLYKNCFIFKISNFDLLSNIRLSNNFFIQKANNNLFLKFFLKKSISKFIKIKYILNLLKINE
jgi:hypothetical protein